MKKNSIGVSATRVIIRILVFLLYYLFLIGIGVATIYAIVMLTIRFLIPTLLVMPKGYISLLIIVGWAGLCCFGLMFALFLIKPLFSLQKSNAADNTVEVEKSDCPKLFEAIEDIVRNTGNKMPKHVYLSAEVNACVFFDSSFWSIFFPVRKNLKIGLGLFDHLSQDELKSIIAHEFGHFGQNSMKVGSSVYVVNQVLYNLTYSHDFWDELLEKWRASSFSAFAFFGSITAIFSNWVRHMNISMYRYVERSYLQLARQMELDADAVSYNYIGSDTFISAMCKTEVNSNIYDFYIDILKELVSEGKIIQDYFVGARISVNSLSDEDRIDIKYDKLVSQPLTEGTVSSRIQIENVWDSHPSLKTRIEEARNNGKNKKWKPADSWNMIPDEICLMVSDTFFSQIDDIEKLQKLTDEEFKEWTKKYVKDSFMVPGLRDFFGRIPMVFDVEEEITNVKNPFIDKNRDIIKEFKVAASDWNLLNRVIAGNVEVESLKYDDQIYSKEKLPLEQHRIYYEKLANEVATIDKNVYYYLISKSDEKDKVPSLYHILYYASSNINVNLRNLIDARNEMHQTLSTFVARSEDDSSYIRQRIIDYVNYLLESIKELNLDIVKIVTGDDYVNSLHQIMKEAHKGNLYFNNDYLNRVVITLPNELMDIHQSLISMAKGELCRITTNIIDSLKEPNEEGSMVVPLNDNDRIEIKMPEIGKKQDKENTTLKSWLYFGGYFIAVCLLCYSLHYCGNGDNPQKTNDGKTYYTGVTANEGEVSDGRIAVAVPSGSVYEKFYPDSTNNSIFGFVISDNMDSPSYQIRIISDHIQGAFGENDLANFIDSYTQSVGLDSIEHDAKAVSQDYLDSYSKVFCYKVRLLYETEPRFKADIAAIRSYDTSTICFVISESLEDTETPFEDIVKGIRFK